MKAVEYNLNSGKGPSPSLWTGCDWLGIIADPNMGKTFFDHFTSLAATAVNYNIDVSDNNCSQSLLATTPIGENRLIITADDNEETWFSTVNALGQIDMDSTTYGKLWFEARIKTSSIATDNAVFCGLTSVVAAGDNIVQVDDTGALDYTNSSFVGFRTLCADGDGLDCVYGTAAGSETVLLESASGITAQTLTADTYVKVGLRYDPADDYVRYFVDGSEVCKVLSTASGFPDAINLYFTIGNKVGANQALTTTIDWVRFAQLWA